MTDFATPSPPPPPAPPTLPPRTPAGRPRIWQAALLFLAFGVVAGGSCAGFLDGNMRGPYADTLALAFVATAPLAAGAFTLLVFRIWRRRTAEAWPSLAQAVLIAFAGGILAFGGCGGFTATTASSALWPIGMVLGAAFVVGVGLAIGGVELFGVGLVRLILKRPGAR